MNKDIKVRSCNCAEECKLACTSLCVFLWLEPENKDSWEQGTRAHLQLRVSIGFSRFPYPSAETMSAAKLRCDSQGHAAYTFTCRCKRRQLGTTGKSLLLDSWKKLCRSQEAQDCFGDLPTLQGSR